MKTPLTYYGGKQRMAAAILSLIPEHKIYAEPFAGGAAVYFAKEPSLCEVINDTNGELVNFYEVVKRDFSALQSEIEAGPRGRKQRRNAEAVYNNPDMFDRVKRAWAVRTPANASCGSMLDGSFGYDRKGKFPAKPANKRGRSLLNTRYGCKTRKSNVATPCVLSAAGTRRRRFFTATRHTLEPTRDTATATRRTISTGFLTRRRVLRGSSF